MVELVFLLAHQRAAARRGSAGTGRCSEAWSARRSPPAPRPDQLQDGPWHVGQRPLRRPGRNGLRFVPLVTRGRTEIMMPTPEEAEELVAFLNWCGMPEFGES